MPSCAKRRTDRLPPIAFAALLLAGSGSAFGQDDLAGFYYITPGGIGAGYADHFALFRDGRWEFGDQYLCEADGALHEETVPRRAGTWAVEDGMVVLSEAERTVITGGACACDAIACDLVGGTERVLETGGTIFVDPAAACASEHDPMAELGVDLPCLTIEGTGYFRIGWAEDHLP